MLALKVRRGETQNVLSYLFMRGLVDRTKRIVEANEHVFIPLVSDYREVPEGAVVEVEDSEPRKSGSPLQRIRNMLDIPADLKSCIPRKWELLGDVLVFKLDPSLKPHAKEISKVYASVLHAKTVFEDVGGIKDEFRKPGLKRLWGSDAETVHTENGIRYKLDASRLMFSSGNKHERMRMADIDMTGEIVVDMFAGIGYFALPIAKYCNPKRVVACEKNPVAFRYLNENARLNRLDNLGPVLKDCRELELDQKVDRIIMGYVKDTCEYLPKAFGLIASGGIIHYHDACPVELLSERPTSILESYARDMSRKIKILEQRTVKSYAPKVAHVVVDLEVA